LVGKLKVSSTVYTNDVDPHAKVLIVDTVGLLTRIYSYADIAYVGGAVGTSGLHNILEPAVFGMPILVGAHISKFPEAKALSEAGGLRIVHSAEEFQDVLKTLITNTLLRNKMSQATQNFVQSQLGATKRVIAFLK